MIPWRGLKKRARSGRDGVGDVWPSLIAVGFGLAWIFLTTGRLGLWDGLLLTSMTASMVFWGRIIASFTSIGRDSSYPMVFLLGTAFNGSIISLVRWFVGWPMAPLFVVLLIVGVLLGIVWDKRGIGTTRGIGVLATFLSFAAATAWLQHYFPPMIRAGGEVVVRPIRDMFIHSHQVTLLSYPGAMSDLGRYGLADEPIPFYHYASYVFPAILNGLGTLSAFDAIMAVWLPLSFVLVGLGVFVLGESWFGPRAGIWCLVAVVVLPDPSYWTGGLGTIGTSIYSLHRFLQFASANAYAIAVAGAALALLSVGYRDRSLGTVGMGVLLSASCLFFKAQIFLAAFPLTLLVVGGIVVVLWGDRIALSMMTGRGLAIGLVGVVLALLMVIILPSTHLWQRTPTIQWEWPPGERFADFLLVRTMDDPPAAALARRSVVLEGLGGLTLRLLLVLFVAFRWWLIPLTLLVASLVYGRRFRPIHLIALMAMVIYVAYAMLLAPNITGHPFGNPWDLQFVPFCWAYFVVVVWLIGMIRDTFSHWFYGLGRWPLEWGVVALVVPAIIGRADIDDWQTGQRWAHLHLDSSLLECTHYLRFHAAPAERIQDSMIDPLYVVEALSERRAYVGWPVVGSYTARDPADEIFQRRQQEVRDWLAESTVDGVLSFAKARQIRWLLVHPESELHWPASLLSRPAFQVGGYRVYDMNLLVE